MKAFNKTNDNTQAINNSPYTQGVGVFYREEFNTIGELYKQYLETIHGWKHPKKKEEQEAKEEEAPVELYTSKTEEVAPRGALVAVCRDASSESAR